MVANMNAAAKTSDERDDRIDRRTLQQHSESCFKGCMCDVNRELPAPNIYAVHQGMAAVLSESKMVQNGPKWSKRPFWSKWPYSELDLSIRETKMVYFGPFWPDEVHFGPFRSANRTLAIHEYIHIL